VYFSSSEQNRRVEERTEALRRRRSAEGGRCSHNLRHDHVIHESRDSPPRHVHLVVSLLPLAAETRPPRPTRAFPAFSMIFPLCSHADSDSGMCGSLIFRSATKPQLQ